MFFHKSKSINNPSSTKEENVNLHNILRAVTEINQAMVGILDSTEVVNLITSKLVSVINVSFADVFIWDEKQEALVLKSITIPKTVSLLAEKALGKPLTTFALYKNNPEHLKNEYMKCFFEGKMIKVDLLSKLSYPMINEQTSNILQKLVGMKLAIAVPLQIKETVIGVLGVIWKNEVITEEENSILKIFTNQISTTIYNTELFKKSNDQVSQLISKNQDLRSLYTLTNNVSQTLNSQEVAQIAVDSLPQDRSMIGGIISSFDASSGILRPVAVTKNTLSEKVRAIIGDFSNYEIDTTDTRYAQNIMTLAIKQMTVTSTTNLRELLSPPVPNQLVPVISKILNIKSVVVFPLISNNKTIGLIEYFLKEKTYEQLELNEKQLFETYTFQIAAALENSILYQESQLIGKNLEKALKQIQEARKHEQDMVDILGHELRTPATVCKGNIELLISKLKSSNTIETQLNAEILSRLHSAYSAIMQETGLINELLTATKLDSGQLVVTQEQIDLLEIVNSTCINYAEAARKNNIDLKVIDSLINIPSTIGDRIRIGEVVDNLISNAIKYTKEGSIIISLRADKQKIYFSIKDTGNGIPREELPLLFQKFKRVNNYIKGSSNIVRPNGTGLGLYVSKGIIEAHNGEIWVESEGEGKGSTFLFWIPILELDKSLLTDTNELDMFKKLKLK